MVFKEFLVSFKNKISGNISKNKSIYFAMLAVIISACSVTLAVFESRNILISEDITIEQPETIQYDREEELSQIVQQFEGIMMEDPGDVTPPLLLAPSVVIVEVGSEKVPGPTICIDDVDKSVECKVVGKYNLDAVGSYNLERVATDSSGNSIRMSFTLKVVEKIDPLSEDEERPVEPLDIQDAISMYSAPGATIGIDVSKWQGNVDWNKVAKSGVKFVMIRLGAQDGFHGENTLDEYFIKNYEGARSAGLKIGVYYYSYATSIEEAAQQGMYVVNTLKEKGYTLDLPIAYDWESWSRLSGLNMSLTDFNNCAKIFMETVEKAGYKSCLYSSKYYLENGLWTLSKRNLWLAHYIRQTTYTGKYMMWQCSCTGKVPGIYGFVDINVLYE